MCLRFPPGCKIPGQLETRPTFHANASYYSPPKGTALCFPESGSP